jgi:ATP-dependent Clp protease adaptor protein ClpS
VYGSFPGSSNRLSTYRKSKANRIDLIFSAQNSAMATEAPEIQEQTKEKTALETPWQVVVHNDPVNLMTYVTMVFKKVFGFSTERARRHMMEVHLKGRSIVWSGPRERAEFYVQQLHGYQLLATMERVE